MVPSPDSLETGTPGDLEARYRALLVELYERLTFRGISRTGKAISLLLEDVYVDLQVVTDAPEVASAFHREDHHAVDAGAGGAPAGEVDLQLDSLRLDRLRHEGAGGRRSIEAMLADPEHPGLVLLGDPGSGKSTLLHLLALRGARTPDRLPVFVPLAAYDDWLRRNPGATSLGDFLALYYEEWRALPELGPVFRRALDEGRALVLLDGLDEVLDVGTRQHVAGEVRALIQREAGRGNRFVVTSRIVGYREATLTGDLAHATVVDFGEAEIARFVHKWCEACEVWLAGGQPSEAALLRARTEESALLDEVRANESVFRLAANPLLLTMLALLRRQGGKLPDERVKLYQRYVEALLDNNWENVRSEGARTKEPERFDQRLATDYLIELALWLQQHKSSGMARRHDIEEALVGIALRVDGLDPSGAPDSARRGAQEKAARFVEDMRHFAGLLAERGRDAFGFAHLTFQEYFAGRALARMEPEERWAIIKPNLHKPRWREPILLCAGQLGIVERRNKEVSNLGRRVLGAESPHEDLLRRDVFLLGAMAADNVGLDKALLDELAGRLIDLADSPIPKVRADALSGLAQLVRVDHEGARIWLEDMIRGRQRLSETVAAVQGILGLVACADIRGAVIELFEDPDWNARRTAVYALEKLIPRDIELRKLVVERMSDPHASVRRSAIDIAVPLAGQDADIRRIALRLTHDPDEDVRRVAIIGLGVFAPTDPDVWQVLLGGMQRAFTPQGSAAYLAFGLSAQNNPQARTVITSMLASPDSLEQIKALLASTKVTMEDDNVCREVLKKIDAPDAHIRDMALYALVPVLAHSTKGRDIILNRLSTLNTKLGHRAFEALKPAITVDAAIRRLALDRLTDSDISARLQAMDALIAVDDAQVSMRVTDASIDVLNADTPPWSTLSASEGPQARAQAAAVLGQLGHLYRHDEIITHLIRILQEDSEPDVLDAAYRSLLRLIDTPDPLLSPGAGTSAPGDLAHPLILERLTIRNFKNLEHLPLDFTHGSALEGRWTCIAGINGAGKSAILQAIALLLLGENLATDIGSEWLKRMRRRDGDRAQEAVLQATVRRGDTVDTIALTLGDLGIDRDRVQGHPAYSGMRAFWEARPKYLVVGYGAGRNLSERLGDDDGRNQDVRRLMTLFDPLYPLASADVLLHQKNERAPVLTLLRRLLATILSDTGLSVAPELGPLRFLVEGAHIPPADLPDGFRATIAWLADLCAAWYDKAPEEALTGDPSRIRAIVLVDEIDLHLHAKLQRVLIPRLRKALPHVQWIVTTHSPLMLSSFDRREIVALDRNQPEGKRVLDRQIIGFTVNEVYEWLMDTGTRSEAFEQLLADGKGEAALILAQSPTVSEQDAKDNRAWRRELAAKKKSAGSP